MKIKNMALVGMGMLGTLAIQKYGMPAMKQAKKTLKKSMNNIEQMM